MCALLWAVRLAMPMAVFLAKLATFFLQPTHASTATLVLPTAKSAQSRLALIAFMAFTSMPVLARYATVL